MKTLNTIILALGAVVGTTGLNAQTKAVANIPFEFKVATVTMPAGEYSFQSASPTRHLIRLVNKETHESVLVLVSDTTPPKGKQPANGKVTFRCYAGQYFFSAVWTPDGPEGKAVPSKLERELQARNGVTEMASVSLPLTGAE
jgi:hypothetical protein